MATRSQVFDFVRNKYRHEVVGDFTLKVDFEADGSRHQALYAHVTDTEMQVTSPFAWQSKVGADKVFATHSSMFGVVTVNGAWALKHNVLIADIDESEIVVAFDTLAAHADALESALGFEDVF